jgi:hypothetical protein
MSYKDNDLNSGIDDRACEVKADDDGTRPSSPHTGVDIQDGPAIKKDDKDFQSVSIKIEDGDFVSNHRDEMSYNGNDFSSGIDDRACEVKADDDRTRPATSPHHGVHAPVIKKDKECVQPASIKIEDVEFAFDEDDSAKPNSSSDQSNAIEIDIGRSKSHIVSPSHKPIDKNANVSKPFKTCHSKNLIYKHKRQRSSLDETDRENANVPKPAKTCHSKNIIYKQKRRRTSVNKTDREKYIKNPYRNDLQQMRNFQKNWHYQRSMFKHISSQKHSTSFLMSRNDIPPSFRSKNTPTCISYHIRGFCYDNCRSAIDHTRIPEDKLKSLLEWCNQQCFKIGPYQARDAFAHTWTSI